MKMTVGELVEKLQALDQDKQVAMSQDSEGNGYSALIEPEEVCNVVVLYPGHMDEIDELEDYEDEEEDIEQGANPCKAMPLI